MFLRLTHDKGYYCTWLHVASIYSFVCHMSTDGMWYDSINVRLNYTVLWVSTYICAAVPSLYYEYYVADIDGEWCVCVCVHRTLLRHYTRSFTHSLILSGVSTFPRLFFSSSFSIHKQFVCLLRFIVAFDSTRIRTKEKKKANK